MTLIKCPYLIFYFNNVHQQLRREGARLFMLWFQALQGNSDELCQVIYASLIPGFPNPIESVEWTGSSKLSKEGAEEIFQSICETGCYERQSSTSSVHLPSAEKESEGHYLQFSCIFLSRLLFSEQVGWFVVALRVTYRRFKLHDIYSFWSFGFSKQSQIGQHQ